MCDYSLHAFKSRPAQVNDKLISTDFDGNITRGFVAAEGPKFVAICLRPGTELSFSDSVRYYGAGLFPSWPKTIEHKTAVFRQINLEDPNTHHDALEFPGGKIVPVTRLVPGQKVTVLQLPAQALPEGGDSAPTNVSTDQTRVHGGSPRRLIRA